MPPQRDMADLRVTDASNPKDTHGLRKPRLDLIPPSAEIAEALVLAHGARKYGAWNWRTATVRATVYVAAARRHLAQWLDGADLDAESGLSHLAHARANLGILIDALSVGRCLDDRPPPGSASQLLEVGTSPIEEECA